MKFSIILLVILYSEYASAQFGLLNRARPAVPSLPAAPALPSVPAIPKPKLTFPELTLPKSFDPLNINKFVGFNASFDGQPFNPFQFDINNIFDRFTKQFNRNYSEEEKPQRRENILNSILKIAKHIIESATTGASINLGLTELSDYSDAEYKSTLGLRLSDDLSHNIEKRSASSSSFCKPKLAESVLAKHKSYDLRDFGYVPPVRNQGQCGSCWIFASVGALETQWTRKKNAEKLDLSEQDLINCVELPSGPGGCNGGDPRYVFNFVKQNGTGLESSGPYIKKKGVCKKDRVRTDVKLTDYCLKGKRTDKEMMLNILSFGAIVVSIDASDDDIFQNYKGGVVDIDKLANSKGVNHAVVLVGWGTEKGSDYWIIRNSYGKGWGLDGYVLIARNKNMCGINTANFYPVIN